MSTAKYVLMQVTASCHVAKFLVVVDFFLPFLPDILSSSVYCAVEYLMILPVVGQCY